MAFFSRVFICVEFFACLFFFIAFFAECVYLRLCFFLIAFFSEYIFPGDLLHMKKRSKCGPINFLLIEILLALPTVFFCSA